jgi:hypothetical protein
VNELFKAARDVEALMQMRDELAEEYDDDT